MNDMNDMDTIVTLALVLRMPLEKITELKEYLGDLGNTKIVHQKLSVGKLVISEEK